MKIDNTTEKEWVESDSVLVIDNNGNKATFIEHYERVNGRMQPVWPPGVTKNNSKIIDLYDVIVRADAEIVADGTDTAEVEIETTAEETREVTLSVADTEVATYQIDPGQIITESITTTTTDETIEIKAVDEANFRESATIDVVQ